MKKGLFVVRVDDYFPELCEITLPTIERYAQDIGASFTVIDQRQYPDFPPTYEKFQIYDLGSDNDLNILVDSDIAITEDMYDVTDLLTEGQVGVWMQYDPRLTIKEDEYIRLDGSDTIAATNFVVTTRHTHEIWRPFDMSVDRVLGRMRRPFVVDEYCFGRNSKMYGIPYRGIISPGAEGNLFFHANINTEGKAVEKALIEFSSFLD